MKIAQASLLALLLPVVSARFVEDSEIDQVGIYTDWAKQVDETTQKYHIELSAGETRWVTEEEKWELRRVSPNSRHRHLHVAYLILRLC